jgi:hypothetical protein
MRCKHGRVIADAPATPPPPPRANRLPEALEYLREAISTMQRDGTSALHKVTMGYNLARLQEETGDIKAASQAYKVGSGAWALGSVYRLRWYCSYGCAACTPEWWF